MAMLSHWLRTLRWQLLNESIGYKTSLKKNYAIVLSSYIVHLAVPRGGDIYRAGMAQRYEKIPFNKALGTIILERLVDSLMLFVIIVISLFFSYQNIEALIINLFSKLNVTTILILTILTLFLMLGFKFSVKKKWFIFNKLSKWILQIKEGIISIQNAKKMPFVIYSVAIWILYVLMFYVASLSLPGIGKLSFGAVIVTFVLASFSYALTNGGLGAYPIAVQQSLIFFGYSKIFSLSLGWIIWGSQTLMIVIFGGISIIYLSISKSKQIGKI